MAFFSKVIKSVGNVAKVGLGLVGKALPGPIGMAATAVSKLIPETKKKEIQVAVQKAGVIDQSKLTTTLQSAAKTQGVTVTNDDLPKYLESLTKEIKQNTGVQTVVAPVNKVESTPSTSTPSKATNLMLIIGGSILAFFLLTKKR